MPFVTYDLHQLPDTSDKRNTTKSKYDRSALPHKFLFKNLKGILNLIF